MSNEAGAGIPVVKVPVVYSDAYNIRFYGVEKLHPFDCTKNQRVYEDLLSRGFFKEEDIARPAGPVSEEDLKTVHTDFHLENIASSTNYLSYIFELPILNFIPASVTNKLLITPMKHQMQGTVMAGQLAAEFGWAINLGGGMHHGHRERGEGFCPFADITLSINKLRESHPDIKKIMVIDLDAHQGNGHERDFFFDQDVFTMDFYNVREYPGDDTAKRKIDWKEELAPFTRDEEYLGKLSHAFNKIAETYKPDAVYYIAGTDILAGDKVGRLDLTPEGVIKRDEMVFDFAFKSKAPIVMMFGGGYQKNNAKVIADSMANLNEKFRLFGPKP
jgi:histone deacetylase 11